MIQIHPGLFLGSEIDAAALDPSACAIHAAKEPWHRRALGYTGRAADKSHPEYLFAERTTPEGGQRLILNLVDVPDPAYIPVGIVDKAIQWLSDRFSGAGSASVLVHCNEGRSRCGLIGMLYLASVGALARDFETAEKQFRGLYSPYQPGKGVHGFLRAHYAKYRIV